MRSDSQRTVLRFLEHCALVLGEPCSGSRRTVLWFSENRDLVLRDRALVLGEPCSGSRRTVLWFSENCSLVLREPCSGSRRTVLWFSENRALVLGAPTEICSGSPNIWITRLEPKIFVSLRWEPRLHFVGVCGKSIRRIKRNNCTRCN